MIVQGTLIPPQNCAAIWRLATDRLKQTNEFVTVEVQRNLDEMHEVAKRYGARFLRLPETRNDSDTEADASLSGAASTSNVDASTAATDSGAIDESPWLSVRKSADGLGVDERRVRQLLAEGQLAGRRRSDGRRPWEVERVSLMALIEKRRGGRVAAH